MDGIRGMLIIGATALPPFVLIFFIRRMGGNPREYRVRILELFAAGFLMPVAAGFAQWAAMGPIGFVPPGLVPAAQAFLGIALPEEALKTAALVWGVRRRRGRGGSFGGLTDGAVYGVITAMGFALMENILYAAGAADPMRTALYRGFTALPLHALTGGIVGLALARVRIGGNGCRGGIPGALLLAVLLHGAYDWILIDPGVPGVLIFALLAGGWSVFSAALFRAGRADGRIC